MSSEAIADFATPKLLSSISTTSDTTNLAETEKSEAHPPLVQILKGISCRYLIHFRSSYHAVMPDQGMIQIYLGG